MDQITSALEGNDTLASLVSMIKTIMRAILPLIGLGMLVKYFEDEEETE